MSNLATVLNPLAFPSALKNGFFKIDRADIAWMNAVQFSIWCVICRLAAIGPYDEQVYNGLIHLTEGQLVAHRSRLVELAARSDWEVRSALKAFQERGLISMQVVGGKRFRTNLISLKPSPKFSPLAHKKSESNKSLTNSLSASPPGHSPFLKRREDRKEEQLQTPPSAGARARVKGDSAPMDIHKLEPMQGGSENIRSIALSPTPGEQELIQAGERALGQDAAPATKQAFIRELRSDPIKNKPEKIKADFAWMGSHPKVRRETESINRVFHCDAVRAKIRPWDVSQFGMVEEMQRSGRSRQRAMDEFLGAYQKPDRAIVVAFYTRIFAAVYGGGE